MITVNQLIKRPRKKKFHFSYTKQLKSNPQLKAICLRIFTVKPKKPNSAIRKVAKVILSTLIKVICYIPGQGHNLQEHSTVLVRGGKIPDLPGVHYKLIRGKYDFDSKENFIRTKSRSKFGLKKNY